MSYLLLNSIPDLFVRPIYNNWNDWVTTTIITWFESQQCILLHYAFVSPDYSLVCCAGPFTIFVPTDKAFRSLLVQLGGPDRAEDKFRENPRLLIGVIKPSMFINIISLLRSHNFVRCFTSFCCITSFPERSGRPTWWPETRWPASAWRARSSGPTCTPGSCTTTDGTTSKWI